VLVGFRAGAGPNLLYIGAGAAKALPSSAQCRRGFVKETNYQSASAARVHIMPERHSSATSTRLLVGILLGNVPFGALSPRGIHRHGW